MGWFTNIEKMAAHKLKDVFMGAKKIAEQAGDDVVAAQHALDLAKQKAADLSAKAHAAAVMAAQKAQAEADAKVKAEADAAQAAQLAATNAKLMALGLTQADIDALLKAAKA